MTSGEDIAEVPRRNDVGPDAKLELKAETEVDAALHVGSLRHYGTGVVPAKKAKAHRTKPIPLAGQ